MSSFHPVLREEEVEAYLQLVEVLVHVVLAARGVYPAAAFERRRAWGVVAAQARHPRVCESVAAALRSARPLVVRGTVEALVLLLADATTGAPKEQYVFALRSGSSTTMATRADLDSACAAAVLKLSAGVVSPALPPRATTGEVTFALLLRSHEVAEGPAAAASLSDVFGGGRAALWARIDTDDAEASFDVSPRRIAAPIKTVRAGNLDVEVSVEFER